MIIPADRPHHLDYDEDSSFDSEVSFLRKFLSGDNCGRLKL
jgi:hypothetical protein